MKAPADYPEVEQLYLGCAVFAITSVRLSAAIPVFFFFFGLKSERKHWNERERAIREMEIKD